jgi:hypothetical protein
MSPAPGPLAHHAGGREDRLGVAPVCQETMPGNGCTSPKPHRVPSPTRPDHTATAAGAAISTSGQHRTL